MRSLVSGVRLTPRGVVAAVLGALLLGAGQWWSYPTLRGTGAALLVVVLLGVATVAWPVSLRLRRAVDPPRTSRGSTCHGTLRLTNASGRSGVSLEGSEHVGGEPGARGTTVVPVDVPWIAAGATEEIRYPLPTGRIGSLPVGPLRLRRQGLAGIARRQQHLGGTTTLVVTPAVLPCQGVPSGIRRGHVGADERVERGGTDLTGLREYVPGDDLRRLHWATTARTGTLMIREDSDPSRAHLTVLVDDRDTSYAGEGPSHLWAQAFDEAADVAASLVAAAAASAHPARLLSLTTGTDREVPVLPGQAGGSPHAVAPALTALSDVATLRRRIAAGEVEAPAVVAPPLHDTDVLAVVTGGGADIEALLAGTHASLTVVLVVDPLPERPLSYSGASPVLRGPRASDLLGLWDRAVVG